MRVFNNDSNHYMMMPKDFLRNPRLSLEAKGTMSMLIYHNVAEDSHLYRWGMNATSTEFT